MTQTKDTLVRDIVVACQQAASKRKLTIAFQHQKGHQSSFVSGNEFAAYNAKADALATQGASADGAQSPAHVLKHEALKADGGRLYIITPETIDLRT